MFLDCFSLKPRKVVILLAGRHAGCKAVVVKTFEDGTHKRKFGHALVVGIEKTPLKVTKSMSKKKVLRRSRVKPFVKCVNYQHMMPTRYTVDIDLQNVVKSDGNDAETRSTTRKQVKQVLEQRYLKSGKPTAGVTWFYSKLRF